MKYLVKHDENGQNDQYLMVKMINNGQNDQNGQYDQNDLKDQKWSIICSKKKRSKMIKNGKNDQIWSVWSNNWEKVGMGKNQIYRARDDARAKNPNIFSHWVDFVVCLRARLHWLRLGLAT